MPELVVSASGGTAWLTLVTTDPSHGLGPRRRLATSRARHPPGHATAGHDAAAPPRADAGRAASVAAPRRCPVRSTRSSGWRPWRSRRGRDPRRRAGRARARAGRGGGHRRGHDLGGVLGGSASASTRAGRTACAWARRTHHARAPARAPPRRCFIHVHRGTATARARGTLDRQDLPEGATRRTSRAPAGRVREAAGASTALPWTPWSAGCPYADEVSGGEHPFILALPNVAPGLGRHRAAAHHVTAPCPSALELAEAVRPTAAALPTPTPRPRARSSRTSNAWTAASTRAPWAG
ncbi:hypothetical protein QJS66_19805 [Kocuria rhizophila]|nr:hypothetical protein QJS66_19805 [Kocuria rhizophila]